MTTKTAFFAIFICIASKLYSQNYIYKGSQQYLSTKSWDFPTNITGMPESIELMVAKTKTGGYIMLSADVLLEEESISGTVTLILANGKMLALTNRVAKDYVDGKSKVLYVLSGSNYALLKNHDIEKIRFSILTSHVNTRKSFTATNKRHVGYLDTEPPRYNTAEEINALED